MTVLVSRREVLTYGAIVGAGGVGFVACNTAQWIDVVLADLPTALKAINAILMLFGKGSIPPQYIQQAQTDLQTVETLVNQYKSAPSGNLLTQIDNALNDAQTNLQAILTMIHVYDPKLVAAISAGVGAATIVVISIQALIPAPPAPPTARVALAERKNGSAVMRAAFDEIFTASGYSDVQI